MEGHATSREDLVVLTRSDRSVDEICALRTTHARCTNCATLFFCRVSPASLGFCFSCGNRTVADLSTPVGMGVFEASRSAWRCATANEDGAEIHVSLDAFTTDSLRRLKGSLLSSDSSEDEELESNCVKQDVEMSEALPRLARAHADAGTARTDISASAVAPPLAVVVQILDKLWSQDEETASAWSHKQHRRRKLARSRAAVGCS